VIDQSEWILDQIVDRFPGDHHANRELVISSLITSKQALDGVPGKLLFGLTAEVAYTRTDEIRRLLSEALEAWRSWCAAHDRELGAYLERTLSYVHY
jgi:hypothetical protein